MAAAALVMSACTQDVAEKDSYSDFTGEVRVTATSNGTRTAITPNGEGNLDVTWVGGEDQIGIFAYDEGEMAISNAAYTATESGSYSAFATTGEAIRWGEGSHDFYAYYPYAQAEHYTAVYANVPAVQEQSEVNNLEHIAPIAFMYAANTGAVKSAEGVEFAFRNAFSVVEVNICAAAGTIDCEGIIFRATDETEIVSASNICVNIATGALSFDSAEGSNEVKVVLGTPATLDTETPQTVYAMITPGHGGKEVEALAIVGGAEVSLGKFTLPESGIPASVLATLSLNVPEPAPVNLSENGTANTYIVPALGKYTFNATVKGNGRTGEIGCGRWNSEGVHTFVNGNAGENQTSVDLAPASAELLWYQAWNPGYKQYALDCPIDASSVALVDGKVEFKTAATYIPGNAVIAVKDAEGAIIWSWHLWFSQGYDPEATQVNTGKFGIIAMDRNIGANIADFTQVNDGWVAAQAVGMTYQWGRKDPFPGPIEISDDTADGNRGGVGYGAMAADGTLMYGSNGPEGNGQDRGYIYIANTDYIHGLVQDAGLSGDWTYAEAVAYANANPHRLIHNRDRSGNNYHYDWWGTRNTAAKAQILYVWGAPGWKQYTSNALKTIYDPCPAGWIVPSTDFSNIAAGLEGENNIVTKENYGWSVVTPSGAKLYFPRTGTRWGDATSFQQCNKLGAYWTSLMSDLACAAYNFTDKDGAFVGVSNMNGPENADDNNSAHAYGISTRAIRCVKESNAFVPSEPEPEPEPEPTPEVIDLSATATSNCYIVNTPGAEYKFKATVKGNGMAPMAGETAEIAPTKARMLWAQSGMTMTAGDGDDAWPSGLGDAGALDMIDYTTVELKDGYVHFTTGEEMVNGNAVIAVTNDEGTILWSWHLWMLNDYDPAAEDYYVTTNNVNVYMMDRNLGATATPKNGVDTNNEWLGARGFYYQWGRKDPFASHNAKWNGYETRIYVYDENGEPQKYDAEGNVSAEGEVDWIYVKYSGYTAFPRVSASNIPNAGDVYASVAYAVANPMTYLTGGASYMWTAGTEEHIVSGATNEWGKLWGNQKEGYSRWDKEGVKTMYDPCPAGYRVPGPGHFAFVTAHNDDAGAGYNSMAAWKYNCVEKLFDEVGNKNYPDGLCQGKAPYGLHFYVKGSKTATPGAEAGAQDYGVAPEDATTAYFPAQGFFNWSASERTANGESPNIYAHTNAVKNAEWYGYSTYFLQAEAQGEFFTMQGSCSYGEQQAKAMPVRCFRE